MGGTQKTACALGGRHLSWGWEGCSVYHEHYTILQPFFLLFTFQQAGTFAFSISWVNSCRGPFATQVQIKPFSGIHDSRIFRALENPCFHSFPREEEVLSQGPVREGQTLEHIITSRGFHKTVERHGGALNVPLGSWRPPKQSACSYTKKHSHLSLICGFPSHLVRLSLH